MNPSTKNWIGASLVSVGLLLFWAAVFPKYSQLGPLKAAIAEREQLLTERQALLKTVTDLNKEYEKRSEALKRVDLIAPTKENIAELLSTLEAIAAKTNVTLSDISLTRIEKTEENPHSTVAVGVKVVGDYVAILTFLDTLEKNIRLVDVTSLIMRPDPVQPTILEAAVKGTAYFFQTL